jgi:hypothetical protein
METEGSSKGGIIEIQKRMVTTPSSSIYSL